MTGLSAAQLLGFLFGLTVSLYLLGVVRSRAVAERYGKILVFLLAALGIWFVGNFGAVFLRLLESPSAATMVAWTEMAALVGLAALPGLMVHTHWLYLGRSCRRGDWERRLYPPLILLLYATGAVWPWLVPADFRAQSGDLFDRVGAAGPGFLCVLAGAYVLSALLQRRLSECGDNPVEGSLFRKLFLLSVAIPAWTLLVYFLGWHRLRPGPWLALSAKLAAIVPCLLIAYAVGRHRYLRHREAHRLVSSEAAESLDRSLLWEKRLAMQTELQRKSRLEELGRMAAAVAHSVKNPLSSMKTLLQLLLEADNLTTEQRMEVRMMVAEVDRLAETVTQLLLFSRTDQPRTEVAGTDLAELVGRLASLFRGDFERRGIVFESSVPPDCRLAADRRVLQDILENLIKNAVEACSEGDGIRIEARAEGPEWRILVEDEGKGIPPEIREQLFQPFVTDKSKGTGLGLSIVRTRVDALGGRVQWTPGAQRGTRFILWLPDLAVGKTLPRGEPK